MKMNSWALDAAHSEVYFKVRHLLISSVSGQFRRFSGTLTAGNMDTFQDARLTASIDVYSIDTNETDRDEHLKSAEFLDADAFPDLTLVGSNFRHLSGDRFEFDADITIKGITKTIVMQMDFGGELRDGFYNIRAGIELSARINRKDFGIHHSGKTDSGSLVIGEEVQLGAYLQFWRDL